MLDTFPSSDVGCAGLELLGLLQQLCAVGAERLWLRSSCDAQDVRLWIPSWCLKVNQTSSHWSFWNCQGSSLCGSDMLSEGWSPWSAVVGRAPKELAYSAETRTKIINPQAPNWKTAKPTYVHKESASDPQSVHFGRSLDIHEFLWWFHPARSSQVASRHGISHRQWQAFQKRNHR